MYFKGVSVFTLPLRRKRLAATLFMCIVLGLVFGYIIWGFHLRGISSSDRAYTKIPLPLTTISIARGQKLFVPFILVVQLHSTVTWRNGDVVAHDITTTTQQSNFLNQQTFSFRVSAGGQGRFTFNRVGLYHYFDPTVSTWNAALSRVAAQRGTPHFPLAMDGVIWVQGPINGLPTAALNPIPAGHDSFIHQFLAISHPGSITWHNFDEDPHFVGLVAGLATPINPVDIGLYRIAGTHDVPGGETVTVLINKPGLYYYYCRNHDLIDSSTHRVQALPKASDYPIPMDGFILVSE
jgi:plastocyanin